MYLWNLTFICTIVLFIFVAGVSNTEDAQVPYLSHVPPPQLCKPLHAYVDINMSHTVSWPGGGHVWWVRHRKAMLTPNHMHSCRIISAFLGGYITFVKYLKYFSKQKELLELLSLCVYNYWCYFTLNIFTYMLIHLTSVSCVASLCQTLGIRCAGDKYWP